MVSLLAPPRTVRPWVWFTPLKCSPPARLLASMVTVPATVPSGEGARSLAGVSQACVPAIRMSSTPVTWSRSPTFPATPSSV